MSLDFVWLIDSKGIKHDFYHPYPVAAEMSKVKGVNVYLVDSQTAENKNFYNCNDVDKVKAVKADPNLNYHNYHKYKNIDIRHKESDGYLYFLGTPIDVKLLAHIDKTFKNVPGINKTKHVAEVESKTFQLKLKEMLGHPDYMPNMGVCETLDELLAVRDALGGNVVYKPDRLNGGKGIARDVKTDRKTTEELDVLIKTHGKLLVVEYTPNVVMGDRRAIAYGGDPLDRTLNRIPGNKNGGWICNFSSGGSFQDGGPLSPTQKRAIKEVSSVLKSKGIERIGFDFLKGPNNEDWLSEINLNPEGQIIMEDYTPLTGNAKKIAEMQVDLLKKGNQYGGQ